MTTDVIVVGSGAAGGWAAKALTEAGLRVLILEAGRAPDASERVAPDYWRAIPTDAPFFDPALAKRQHIQQNHPAFTPRSHHFFIDDVANPYEMGPNPFVWIRGRQLGGKTLIWGGQTWRLSDFELQSVAPPGAALPRWPLRYADLAPFYDEIETAIGVSGGEEDYDQLPRGTTSPPRPLTDAETRFAELARAEGLPIVRTRAVRLETAPTDGWPRFSSIATAIADALRTGRCEVKTDAVVERVIVDEQSGLAAGVAYIDARTKTRHTVTSRAVVMAASAIETVRVLLNSAPGGVANSSGVLGKFIVDHPGHWFVVRLPSNLARPSDEPFWNGDGLYIPRFCNLAAQDTAFYGGFAISAWLARRQTAYWCRNIPLPNASPLQEGELGMMLVLGESMPRRESRVTLDGDLRDAYGIPTPRFDVSYGPNEAAQLGFARETALRLCAKLGAEVLAEGGMPPGAAVHELGGARMGSDPTTSYVRPDCRSWEIPNLSVVDGACWPTAAYQNPTLTIMALAVRGARALAESLKRGG